MIGSMRVIAVALMAFGAGVFAAEQKIAADCTPGVSFRSLLGALGIGYDSGYLQMEKLYAVCLPQPAARSDSNYAYSPDHGGRLATVLKNADGQVLATYVWSAENISGLWELSNYKVLGGAHTIRPLAAGNYTLEFQIEGAPFQRIAFVVATVPSDDPYQPPGTRYFLQGPWNDYGNVFYRRNDPQSTLRFSAWVQDKAGHAQEKSLPYSVQLLRVKDRAVIGTDEGTLRADQHWRQLDVSFKPQGGDVSSFLKAGEVLKDDGTYRVHLRVDGKLQAAIRSP